MTLASLMLGKIGSENKIEKIPVKYIRPSKYNKMPIINIDDLVTQIKANGLQNPIHVRQLNETEFVVIGGERRLTATKECGHETIAAIIRHDIQSDREEKIAVAINNVQREETKEILQLKIREWAEIYEEERKHNAIPKGMRRADWIAQFTNCSRSTVQRYLKQYESIDGNKIKHSKNKKTPDMLYLENKLSQFCGSKTIVTNKSVTFKYTDLEELNRILETIGFDLNQE